MLYLLYLVCARRENASKNSDLFLGGKMSSDEITMKMHDAASDHERRLRKLEDGYEELKMRTRSMKIEQDVVDLEQKVSALSEVVEELRSVIVRSPQAVVLQFSDGLYYAQNDPIPWCPNCYEVKQLQRHLVAAETLGAYRCTNCKGGFHGKGYRPDPPPTSQSFRSF